jgi:hypothetical protein
MKDDEANFTGSELIEDEVIHGAAAKTTSGEKLLAPRWPYDHRDAAKVLPAERRSIGSEFQRRCGNGDDSHRRQSVSFLHSPAAAMVI